MWLMRYLTGGAAGGQAAVKGSVFGSGTGTAVVASEEHKGLRLCAPYGVISVPPDGSQAVVLPLEDGEAALGVLSGEPGLQPGELMLFSRGGASIVLKNDGRVLINGEAYTGA